MQKVGMISILIGIALVGFISVKINPYLLTTKSALGELANNQGVVDFFRLEGFNPPGAPSEITSIYRFDETRSGSIEIKSLSLPLKVTWKTDDLFGAVHSASKSTPAADETGIYFGTDLGIFYKVDHSGKIIWKFRTESDQQGIHGTALLDRNNVYFGNYGGWFYCLNKSTGNLVWSTFVANAVGSSPLITGNKIIFAAEFNEPHNGYLVALDIQSGKKIWTTPYFEEQVHSSPTLAIQSGLVGVGSNSGIYWGVDLESGQIRWKYQSEQPIKGTAVYHQGLFCFTSWSRQLHCLHDFSGEEAFAIPLEGSSQSSPALDSSNSSVFVSSSSGYLFKISLKERKVLKRAFLRMDGKSNRYGMASPVLVKTPTNKYVLAPCEDTNVCLFNAEDLKLLQKLDIGGILTGSFNIWNQSIFVNVDAKGLVRIN